MSLSTFCVRNVATIDPECDLEHAIGLMKDCDVDNLVVVLRKNQTEFPIGIVTEKDIVRRSVSKTFIPSEVTVGDVMTKDFVTCDEDDGILDAIGVMRRNKVKHVPVVDEDGVLKGMLSAWDLLSILSPELSGLNEQWKGEPRQRRMRYAPQTAAQA